MLVRKQDRHRLWHVSSEMCSSPPWDSVGSTMRMPNTMLGTLFALIATLPLFAAMASAQMPAKSARDSILASQLIQPEELVKLLKTPSASRPLIFQVGSHVLYAEAHIPDSEYIGSAADESGRRKLRERVKSLPKNASIILYCGCCPWQHCPNVKPAYAELHTLGFTNVKVLYIAGNFGSDWVEKGYPVAKGE